MLRALLACRAPGSARRVLTATALAPAPNGGWLLLSWQAASAALDHEAAVLALRRLADGDLMRLEALRVEVGERRRWSAADPFGPGSIGFA